jgi:nucleotide-binding universal stress UspA family protein
MSTPALITVIANFPDKQSFSVNHSVMKILVPTDFSACAQTASEVALAIARRLQAEIIFLHLHETPGKAHIPAIEKAADPKIGQTKALLEELVNLATRNSLTAKQMLVTHQGGDKIENYIGPLQVDMIIMGSHGATGIRELIIGSHTQRVVRHSSVPVLVIKQKPARATFSNMLYATTLNEDIPNALNQIEKFAKAFEARIHMLYVQYPESEPSGAEAEEQMRNAGKRFSGISFTYNSIATNDPEWGIGKMARELQTDVIVLTTTLKTGRLFFSHKLAEDLVNHESLPVLVINAS